MKLKVIGSNQTEVETASGVTVFFSYNTPVAAHIPGKGFIKTAKQWSKTTSKHVNQWLNKQGSGKAEIVDQEELNKLA